MARIELHNGKSFTVKESRDEVNNKLKVSDFITLTIIEKCIGSVKYEEMTQSKAGINQIYEDKK